ncbi:MAG: hypothetical protein HY852_24525 [Bradyrhizobium sp.]|uniref:hypothetical protein n=1 Tax=Bradyrhizobium sp. TaxID=376 RepID=UPI0025BD4101|nr:hypothetical protein [Bradyrhizobium sp.]MBI5264973.1 hypothetical protein [Bradyrhizobium sp.]
MVHQRAYRAAAGGKQRANKPITVVGMIRRPLIAAAVLFLASISGSSSEAQSGPFAGMAGNWSGSGTVSLEDGSTERIRCRARYAPSGPNMSMSLTCASDAYKFLLAADVTAEGNTITGNWTESSRNIGGTLQGRGGGGNFQVLVSAAGFNANLSLATRGNRQSVSIRADSQFRGANIALSR